MIYLDNAATTFPKHECVYEEMDRINRTLAVNAGRGSYKAARDAEGIIDETRMGLKTLFSCRDEADIVLTPSVTHALNQILYGLDISEDTVIYLSIYEHNAVARTVEHIRSKTGCKVEFIPVNTESLEIDIDRTRFAFSQKKPYIVVMNVISNVTGYRLPVEAVFKMAKEYGAVTIADAAQAAGLINIDFQMFHADIICFAGHKTLGGPFGIGGFAISKKIKLNHVLTGGTGSNSLILNMPSSSPERYEAASPNIVAIAGLNAALKVLNSEDHLACVNRLTAYLYDRLNDVSSVSVLGYVPEQCHGIISIVVEGYDSGDVGKILDDEFDIAVRTGYHCAPYIHQYLKDEAYHGTIRIGIGKFNSEEEIDILIDALETL